jgi:hypothetical protein
LGFEFGICELRIGVWLMDEAGSSSSLPPFLAKTYEMVDDPSSDPIVSWSKSNKSFVVWKCKTIQNVKFTVGTTFNNSIYELTFNGDKNELYVDVYEKMDKVIIKLD